MAQKKPTQSPSDAPWWRRFARLFVIKNQLEAFLIIYALALGASARGSAYLDQYPGVGGQLLFLATTGAVFLGGAAILDSLRTKRELAKLRAELRDTQESD